MIFDFSVENQWSFIGQCLNQPMSDKNNEYVPLPNFKEFVITAFAPKTSDILIIHDVH
jgi:hypothetical protein